MNVRTLTLLFLLAYVLVLVFAFGSFRKAMTETVVQATERYATSGHADRTSISFTNWNNNDPPVIPIQCARCHGTPGFLDFLGEDGSTPWVVDKEAPSGEVITCIACHNPTIHSIERVAFHSGEEFQPKGMEGVCMLCHQSRQSTDGIQGVLQGLPEDEVSADLSFINPHYHFAASTQVGSLARSGYQYPQQQYVGYFAHADRAETCTQCHNAHNLAVAPRKCAVCHSNVVTSDDFATIRTQKLDYDGDGDITEGIQSEIAFLQSLLFQAIKTYAREVAGKPVVYADQFPYYFVDTNDNGIADPDEVNFPNRYNAWTPRLIKAVYNYQFAKNDPGGYVHNPRYVIQLLYDSLMDLGQKVPLPNVSLVRP